MHHLGDVKGLGYDGKLVVKGKFAPKLNLEVMERSKKVIGTIARVFGPVNSPYISVKPAKNYRPSIDIVGKPVYIRENQRIK
ncbi:MAG: hypothetical protein JSV56_13435 [Methanomassiliicoccales archaeon]|nr:MAG: hypothetical protein JSV56_13435 [Methanomassiliicoccales archaeon]